MKDGRSAIGRMLNSRMTAEAETTMATPVYRSQLEGTSTLKWEVLDSYNFLDKSMVDLLVVHRPAQETCHLTSPISFPASSLSHLLGPTDHLCL